MKTLHKHEGYVILGSTGCTCCHRDNFVEGLRLTPESAFEAVREHRRVRTVCSQYSPNGDYTVVKVSAEKINDGRVIIGDRVFNDDTFYETGYDIYKAVMRRGETVPEPT